MVEYPPPVPSPLVCPGLSFQTVSTVDVLYVPPQPTTCGQEDGASTFAGVALPSLESLSPEAAKTIMPRAVALAAADSISLAAFSTAVAMSCDQYMRMVADLPVAA